MNRGEVKVQVTAFRIKNLHISADHGILLHHRLPVHPANELSEALARALFSIQSEKSTRRCIGEIHQSIGAQQNHTLAQSFEHLHKETFFLE